MRSEYGKGSEFRFVIPQRVSDAKPFIVVKNADAVNAVGYIDMQKFGSPVIRQKYKELITEMIKSLKVKCSWFSTLDGLKGKLSWGGITHCFIGRAEYLSDKEYFMSIADSCEVIIVQERVNAVVPETNMKCIYKPFYALSVAAAFNNENIVLNMNERRGSTIRFIAPKARILIVDDNVINLKVAVGLMRPYRMQIATAESAAAAISMLRSKDYDLVFMDHMMPDTDGVEATKMIRELGDDYYRSLPIIALTANAINGVHEMFLEAGMNDFIAKPIELSALDRVLKKWLPAQYMQLPPTDGMRSGDAEKRAAASNTDTFFNPDKGLVYTGGDLDSYLEILELFARKTEEKSKYIRKLFDEQDWKNYVIEVHALKSSSRAVGAIDLSELSKKLELAGKAGDFKVILEQNDELITLYERVRSAAEEYLLQKKPKAPEEVETSASDLPELTRDKLDEYLSAIAEAADNFDGDEIVRLAKEASGYVCGGFILKKSFDEVIELSNDFEYEQAKQRLDGISAMLKS